MLKEKGVLNNQKFLISFVPKSKKCISPAVAMALLLVVAVVSVTSFQSWFHTYSTQTLTGVESDTSSAVSGGVVIEKVIGETLYIINNIEADLNITELKIGDQNCNTTILTLGINDVDVSSCIHNVTQNSPFVLVVTNTGVYSKQISLDNGLVSRTTPVTLASCTLDSTTSSHNQIGTFYDAPFVLFGETCSSSGRTCNNGTFEGDISYNLSTCYVDNSSQFRFVDDKTGAEIYYEVTTLDSKNVVHDKIHGLYWEQSSSLGSEVTWSAAKTHCEGISGGGWRLPTITELVTSLADTERASGPFIIGGTGNGLLTGIQTGGSDAYWSLTRYDDTRAHTYAVMTGGFERPLAATSTDRHVLCVKEDNTKYSYIFGNTQTHIFETGTGQIRNTGEFSIDDAKCGGSGTIYDSITNLCWTSDSTVGTLQYAPAESYCSGLATAGGGWELPDQISLLSLIYFNDRDATIPALTTIGFTNLQNYYWTGTTAPTGGSNSLYIYFDRPETDVVGWTGFADVLCSKQP